MVVGPEENAQAMDVDSFMPPDTAGCGILDRQAQRRRVPAIVAAGAARLSRRSPVQRFLGGVSASLAGGATRSGGERKRGDGAQRTVELHVAATVGAVCA